jgi:hypothetical protein
MGHKCRGHQGHNKLHLKKMQDQRDKQAANKEQRGGMTRAQYTRFLKEKKREREYVGHEIQRII